MKPHQSRTRLAPDPSRCCHLSLSGARCTMPSLNGRDLCFNHDRRRREDLRKARPPFITRSVPLVSFVYMEDHAAILDNLNSIAQAFAQQSIDHRQASALTFLMHTALKTLRQMRDMETAVTPEQAPRDVVYDDKNQAKVAIEATGACARDSETGDRQSPRPAAKPENQPLGISASADPGQDHHPFQILAPNPESTLLIASTCPNANEQPARFQTLAQTTPGGRGHHPTPRALDP